MGEPSRAAQDGVRGGEDGNSGHTTQQHAMDKSDGEIFLRERDGETQRVSRPVGPVRVGSESAVRMDGRLLLNITVLIII